MRVIKKTIYCDRCGKHLSDAEYRHTISFGTMQGKDPEDEWMEDFLGKERAWLGDVKDFCAECTKEFYKWMDEKKEEKKGRLK